MTLEELTAIVDELMDVRVDRLVNASFSIHGLDNDLLAEWVEAYPGLVAGRTMREGMRVAWLQAPPGRSIALFGARPKAEAW